MNLAHHLSLTLCACLVACGDSSSETGSADTTDDSSSADTQDTQDTSETAETGSGACGDGVVTGLEECEPEGPIACEEDCTLPPDGPGTLEWIFVDVQPGDALAVAIDDMEHATVAGVRGSGSVDAWIGRFDPDGTPGWQIEHDGAAGDNDIARDVELDGQGRAIVVGDEGTGGTYADAWIAAYEDDGSEAWSVTQTGTQSFGAHANAVAVLGDSIYVAVDSPAGGIEHEPALAIYDALGALATTRTWAIGYDSVGRALAADPTAMQLVQVGSWNVGNWIEAIDDAAQTLWTANEAIDPSPGDGFAQVQDVAIDGSGSVYVVGEENYNDGMSGWMTAYVRKLSVDGQVDWTVPSLPGFGEHDVAVADGVVYVVGSWSGAGVELVARSAADGAVIWRRELAVEADEVAGVHDLQVGPGSLWLAGYAWVVDENHGFLARVSR